MLTTDKKDIRPQWVIELDQWMDEILEAAHTKKDKKGGKEVRKV